MPVDRSDVGKAQLLEQRAAARHAGHEAMRPPRAGPERLGQGAREPVGDLLEGVQRACRHRGRRGSFDIAPTGGAIDISLSLRITNIRRFSAPALFIAS